MEWGKVLVFGLVKVNSIVSPSVARTTGPGNCPLKVQALYMVPLLSMGISKDEGAVSLGDEALARELADGANGVLHSETGHVGEVLAADLEVQYNPASGLLTDTTREFHEQAGNSLIGPLQRECLRSLLGLV